MYFLSSYFYALLLANKKHRTCKSNKTIANYVILFSLKQIRNKLHIRSYKMYAYVFRILLYSIKMHTETWCDTYDRILKVCIESKPIEYDIGREMALRSSDRKASKKNLQK